DDRLIDLRIVGLDRVVESAVRTRCELVDPRITDGCAERLIKTDLILNKLLRVRTPGPDLIHHDERTSKHVTSSFIGIGGGIGHIAFGVARWKRIQCAVYTLARGE